MANKGFQVRVSKAFIPTVKETPQEAEIPSHKLMLRAGLMRKVASGVYEYLPLGIRSIHKVSNIIREEMARGGAQEVLMPIMTPAELWQETGRWQKYGKELMRLKDRHDRDFALGPTHEEVITDMVRRELKSYKQLPLNLFQIATKFRDEVRPRFGVMRSREFLMKDGYSFDVDEASSDKTYWIMVEAYKRIFRRCGLRFSPVEADSGLIGGSFTHEFMVLADTGECAIAMCPACSYAANLERAEGKPAPPVVTTPTDRPKKDVETPGKYTVEDVSAFLKMPPARFLKTLIFMADGKPVAAIVRGDHDVNEVKLRNFLGADDFRMASPGEVEQHTGAPVGFAGPSGLKGMRIVADHALKGGHAWVSGGMRRDIHVVDLEFGRDCPEPEWGDLRNVVAGDGCPKCGESLQTGRGIEVGQTFKLGLKYSKAMHCVFLNDSGKEQECVMGCYGIGVTRTVAAAIEQHYDENGIRWPIAIAPYQVHLLALNADPDVMSAAEKCYHDLQDAGFEVLFDDRPDASAGFKFKDADLLGLPLSVRVGARGLKEGVIEVKRRREKDPVKVPLADVMEKVREFAEAEWSLCRP
jgi:prolyl-tRNA synthetase